MWTRINWSISNFSVTIIKSSYDVEKWRKDTFYNLRQLTNLLWQWSTTWRKVIWIYLALILTFLKVKRAVILLLKTILWGLLFQNLVPCMTMQGKTPKLLKLFHNLSKIKTFPQPLHIYNTSFYWCCW